MKDDLKWCMRCGMEMHVWRMTPQGVRLVQVHKEKSGLYCQSTECGGIYTLVKDGWYALPKEVSTVPRLLSGVLYRDMEHQGVGETPEVLRFVPKWLGYISHHLVWYAEKKQPYPETLWRGIQETVFTAAAQESVLFLILEQGLAAGVHYLEDLGDSLTYPQSGQSR